jgi:hypothetical protein
MTGRAKQVVPVIVIAVVALIAGCSGDLARSSSPITLIVTNEQKLQRIDIATGAANCDKDIATVTVKPILVTNPNNANLPVDSRFSQVQLTSYRVSYVRRDGGTLVPAPFTRSMSGAVDVDASTALSDFLAFQVGALNQAPFAALRPSGGGRDPETGRNVVTMDVILEVFGQTLAGERVSGSTRLTLDFCYACSGCA